jgi:putative superfamily III holin-X
MRGITEIFTDVIDQSSALLRKEAALARAELSEKISQVGVGLGLIVGGSVLLTPALVILLQTAVSALIEQGILAQPWSALLVGGVALVIGVILLLVGINRLRAEKLVPAKTIHQLQRDVSVAKQQMRPIDENQCAA